MKYSKLSYSIRNIESIYTIKDGVIFYKSVLHYLRSNSTIGTKCENNNLHYINIIKLYTYQILLLFPYINT